jgi:hypothetical protein
MLHNIKAAPSQQLYAAIMQKRIYFQNFSEKSLQEPRFMHNFAATM